MPAGTPSGIRGFELALSFFDDFELDIGTKAHFVSTVYATVVHTALNAIIEQDARARAALTEAEMFEAGRPFVMEVITSGRFPRVSAFIVEAEHLDETARMRAAIELILDGIAARLDALSGAVDLARQHDVTARERKGPTSQTGKVGFWLRSSKSGGSATLAPTSG